MKEDKYSLIESKITVSGTGSFEVLWTGTGTRIFI